MSDRRSIISDRTIGTKIAVGFAAVLLVLAVSSVFAWLAFERVAGAMDDYARLVTNADVFQTIDLQVTRFRGHVHEYIFSNDEVTASMASKEGEALRQLFASGLTKISNPAGRRLLEDAAKQADLYGNNFEHVRAINLEQAKLESDVLDAVGQQMTDALQTLVAGSVKAGNVDLQRLAAEGRRLSLVARLNVSKRLGGLDEAAGKSAEQQFTDLGSVLMQLDAATKDIELNATVKSQGPLLERFQTAFRRATSLDTEQRTLVSGVMKQQGDALTADVAQG
jgi:hypothetical protein